ncbi:MAG: hypothetical protein IKV16_02405 [Clostridia bacterium]|nr:hypothetical protein [Clostridia bacterium]
MNFLKYRRFFAFSDKLCRFLFLLFLILILYGSDSIAFAHLSIICAGIHELAHVVTAVIVEAKIKAPRTAYDGLRLHLELIKSSRLSELLIILSGPASNLFCALFMLSESTYLIEFGAISLITALANLLPCHGNDGYRILNILLSRNSDGRNSVALDYLSLFNSAVILFFSLFMSYRTGSALWLSSVYLIYTLLELEKVRKAAFFRKNEKNGDIKRF